MKKVVTQLLVLVVCILFSCYAFADEFTIHSGVTFGMNESQVEEQENEKGFKLQTGYIGELLFGASRGMIDLFDSYLSRKLDEKVDIPYVSGSIAGFDDSKILFFFIDGQLCSAVYHIGQPSDSTRFTTLSNTLSEKYGEPIANNGEYIDFPSQGQTAIGMYNLFNDFGAFSCSIQSSNQWLVEADSRYISILMLNCAISGHTEVFLSYSSINKDDYDSFISDKLDTINKKEQELNDDL